MAAYNKFNSFVEDVAEKVHNLQTDVLKIMLTNAAPVASNTVKANLTDIGAGFGYTAGGTAVTITASSQTAGVYSLVGSNVVFTAAGGTIGPFRYAAIYNDTQTAPAKPLIAWWDYGSALTLNDTETFTVSFGASILTLT